MKKICILFTTLLTSFVLHAMRKDVVIINAFSKDFDKAVLVQYLTIHGTKNASPQMADLCDWEISKAEFQTIAASLEKETQQIKQVDFATLMKKVELYLQEDERELSASSSEGEE